jgi:hypothetical protein
MCAATIISYLTISLLLVKGTHEELLALNGKYAEMWNMQLHSTREGSRLDLTELDATTLSK